MSIGMMVRRPSRTPRAFAAGRLTLAAILLLWLAAFAAALTLGAQSPSAQHFALAPGSAATHAAASVPTAVSRPPTVVGIADMPAPPGLRLPAAVHRSARKAPATHQSQAAPIVSAPAPPSAPVAVRQPAPAVSRRIVSARPPEVARPPATQPPPAPARAPTQPTGTGTVSGGG